MLHTSQAFSRTQALIKTIRKSAKLRTTYGYLRGGVQLGASGSYTINLNATPGNVQSLITDKRIDTADAFIPTFIGFFIRKAGSSTSPTNAEQVVSILRTFPNSTIFSGANEASNLESLYNSGSLSMTVNNAQLIKQMDIAQFRKVETAQQGVQVSQQAAAVGSNGAWLRDAWDGRDNGFVPFPVDICLNGVDSQSINITLPVSIDCSGTSSANYLDIVLRGVHVLNGSGIVKDDSIDMFRK